MASDKELIVGIWLYMYIMKSEDPKIEPYGTPGFTVPHFREGFSNDFILVFCFLSGSEPRSCCALIVILI
jgi:hypothetical protein